MNLDAELAKLTEIVGAVALPYDGKSVEVEGDGTLILKGTLATCGVDRQMEAFDEASLRTAFQKYFERWPTVVFNHRLNQAIGKLIAANFTRDGEIQVEAEIPKPPEDDRSLYGIYERIRSGALKAFSIGGKWKKVPMPNGITKLFTTEVVEASVAAGLGVNPDALFEVVGVKAMGNLDGELSRLNGLTAGASPLDEQLSRLRTL